MSPMPSPAPISREPLRIEICKDEDDLARRAAGLFVAEAARALGARRQFTVALSGGETPRRMYALLSQENYAFQVVWPAVQVFWSDERCVAPDDPRSNYGCARDALLSKLNIAPENIHRMRGEDDPARAAATYEGVLREHFHGMPRFDLILLGIGSDGHTASLFPGSAAAAEAERWVVATQDPEGAPRLSLTVPVLNAAETIAVLVTGAGKAEIARKVLGTEGRAEGLPIQKVRPTSGQLAWILDEAAASLLEPQAGD